MNDIKRLVNKVFEFVVDQASRLIATFIKFVLLWALLNLLLLEMVGADGNPLGEIYTDKNQKETTPTKCGFKRNASNCTHPGAGGYAQGSLQRPQKHLLPSRTCGGSVLRGSPH